mmetsp:Transcript_39233/g.103822  ORF Transcript_39233/g.103822 Transcript_39233/m.103822 type:complete len:274 (-) Transcript_39233:156-977(-)
MRSATIQMNLAKANKQAADKRRRKRSISASSSSFIDSKGNSDVVRSSSVRKNDEGEQSSRQRELLQVKSNAISRLGLPVARKDSKLEPRKVDSPTSKSGRGSRSSFMSMSSSESDNDSSPFASSGMNLRFFADKGEVAGWAKLSYGLLKHSYWSRLGDLAKRLNKVPDDVEQYFTKIEKSLGIEVDFDSRLQYYKEFVRATLGATVLRFSDVEHLVKRMGLVKHVTQTELYNMMNSKLESSEKSTDQSEFFDLELFLSVACELHQMNMIKEEV